MVQTQFRYHTASSVSQDNPGRVRDLGRGSRPQSWLQSPHNHKVSTKNLRIIQCNINGLSTPATKLKLDQLLELADKHSVEIIALQETKLGEMRQFKLKGFNVLRKDRTAGGGGLMFLVRNVHFKIIPDVIGSSSDLECQGLKILSKDRNIAIINTYHPPNNKGLPIDVMESLFENNTLVLGDLNAKHPEWGCSTPNNRGYELANLANDKAFLFLNDGSHTYRSHSYNSTDALDISIVSPGLFPHSSWKVLDEVGSDHFPILIEIDLKVHCQHDNRLHWNFRRADWTLFEEVSEGLVAQVSPSEDLEREWSRFKSVIFSAAKASIPRGKFKGKRPFFTHKGDPLQSLLHRRSELLKETAQTPSTVNKIELNKLNAEIKREYVQIKRSNWEETCRNLDHRTPNSRLWKLTKSLDKMPVSNTESNAIIRDDGSVTINDLEAAEALAQHYAKESKVTFDRSDRGLSRITRNLVKSCRDVRAENPLFDDDFTADELSYALQHQDLTKSPGPDGIHGQFLNHLGTMGKNWLLHLFNLSWSTGKLPRQWKSAIIIPIRKPNKKASSSDSYRPISLTCIICKLMERIILRRLSHHLLSNDLIPPEQYAFRRGHGTMDQILFFSQHVRDAQNCKPTKHTVAVFLDLTKAFDRVWKYRLVNKCYNDFKIRGRALLWISDFLNHRNFCVNFQNRQSGFYRLYQGIPQGSVLSPTLFTMFIAGIENLVSPCQIGIFADDIVLWSSGTDIGKVESILNRSLEAVRDFSNSHKLSFNASKSTTCFFTTNRHLYNYSPAVYFADQLLDCDKYPIYLGFTLDPEINCKKHIEKIANKARKRLRVLKYISGRDWGANASTLRLTYCSLVRPILEYGYQIFQTASISNLRILDRVQLSAARIITGLRNSCPSEVALYEADIIPLTTRFRISSFKYFNKLTSLGDFNRTSKFVLNWKSNQRLKRDTPLEYVRKEGFINFGVVPRTTLDCLPPTVSLENISFNDVLRSHANKQVDHPDLLKQLALEVIDGISSDALVIYTDGSRLDDGRTGSGVFTNIAEDEGRLSIRNPDHCSVFRSEIMAIGAALKYALTTDKNSFWILTDSKSAIQYFKNWPKIFDVPDQVIMRHLSEISMKIPICLQWIPSHVGVYGNETADLLAKNGCDLPLTNSNELTPSEIHSLKRRQLLSVCRLPPAHHWYAAPGPGLSISCSGPRPLQSAMARFRSGHLKCMRFLNGERIFSPCSCSLPASPAHLLICLGASWRQLWAEQDLVYGKLARRGFLDLV